MLAKNYRDVDISQGGTCVITGPRHFLPKVQMMSLFSHPRVISELYEFLFSVEH